MVRRTRPTLGLALVGLLAFVAHVYTQSAPAPPSPADADLITRFLAPDAKPLKSYRAFRKMTASTRGGKISASLEVWTTLDPVKGFSYQILSEEGSGLIRSRVLKEALEAERKAVLSTEGDEAALTRANYQFLAMTQESSELVKIEVKPLKDHVMRVNGVLYVEPVSADLRRIEGELSKRPSFWTRKVLVQREYNRIGGIHVPVSMHSTADVLIVGASSFSMTYKYAEINGVPVP
jgi:hypothetical protein